MSTSDVVKRGKRAVALTLSILFLLAWLLSGLRTAVLAYAVVAFIVYVVLYVVYWVLEGRTSWRPWKMLF